MKKSEGEGYQKFKDSQAKISRAKSEKGRDIADDEPDCQNPSRRQSAADSLECFCRTYFPRSYTLPWSNDHRTALGLIESSVRNGGQFAYAMPRGSGKTTMAETAAIWATLYGYWRFAVLIGSESKGALEMLDSIKSELESNDLLFEDFRWACLPIRKLEGIAIRCNGQLWEGKRTQIEWTADRLVYPTIPGSLASGGIIKVAGLTGRIRGMKFKRPDGENARPDGVILDDPQTDESARAPAQVDKRAKLISGAVLGLAGPGKKIACVMPCTVIAKDDLADRFLDRKKSPAWQGARAKLIYSLPTNLDLWDRYATVRADSLRAGNEGREGTEFYRANREAMDAGARPAWPDRFDTGEISAVQNAMNIRLDKGEAAFAAEYQNEPLEESHGESNLTAESIMAKASGLSRGVLATGTDFVTAFIDVQGKLLYWGVVGWSQDFGGHVPDYGAFPDQRRDYFTVKDARRTLKADGPSGAEQQGAIYAGLVSLTDMLLGREWKRADGAAMRIGKCLIDANWAESTDTVYKFCRNSPHAAVLMPSHGKYVGATSAPWESYTRKPGERLGEHWLIPPLKTHRAVRHLMIDTNYWKSFVHARFSTAMGDKSDMTLFGKNPNDHRMFADHLTSEYGVKVSSKGRDVVEWKLKPAQTENHWLDVMVGNAVAASLMGCQLLSTVARPKVSARPVRRKVAYL